MKKRRRLKVNDEGEAVLLLLALLSLLSLHIERAASSLLPLLILSSLFSFSFSSHLTFSTLAFFVTTTTYRHTRSTFTPPHTLSPCSLPSFRPSPLLDLIPPTMLLFPPNVASLRHRHRQRTSLRWREGLARSRRRGKGGMSSPLVCPSFSLQTSLHRLTH